MKILRNDGKHDRRTLSACEKAAQRLLGQKELALQIEGNMLKGYHAMAAVLVDVSSADIKHLGEKQFAQWLKVLEDESLGSKLPSNYQKALLTRRCNQALTTQNWKEVLEIMSPFAPQQPFDVRNPSLAGLPDGQADKINTFSKLAQDVLLPAIGDGANSKQQVKDFCSICIATFENEHVDLVSLDHATAACWSSSSAVWNSLACLADESNVDPKAEVVASVLLCQQ